MRISYSHISTYQRCPHKYQLAYIDRIPVADPGVFVLGSAVHGTLRYMHQPGKRTLPPLESVISEFCRCWQGQQDQVAEAERESNFETGMEMLTQHYERETQRGDGRLTADVERSFDVPFTEKHRINGRIDRVDVLADGSLEVIDYKTGRRMPAQSDVDRDLQLMIYRMAVQDVLYPDKTVTTSLYFIRHGQMFTAHPSPRQLEEAQESIREVLDGIERSDFSPKVESSCDWCDFRNHCVVFRPITVPESEKASIDALITEMAEVERLYKTANAEAKQLSTRKGELETAILEWLRNAGAGSYQAGNIQVLQSTRRTTTFPPEQVKAILEPLGLWERVSKTTVSKMSIDSLAKTQNLSPAVLRELREVAEVTEKPVIKLRRLGADDSEEDDE